MIRFSFRLAASFLCATCVLSTPVEAVAQRTYLKASNPDINDRFGSAVAASGMTVVVGAPDEQSSATGINGNQSDNSATLAGAAYVFVQSGSTWTQEAYLKSPAPLLVGTFGKSVAIDGDTLVVGSRLFSTVYTRTGTTWSYEASLVPSNFGPQDGHANSIAIAGATIVVGAHLEDSNAVGVNGDGTNNSAGDSGAAYVFRRTGTIWAQEAYLKASNTYQNDQFGFSVSISGETIVVGAKFEKSNATGVNGSQNNLSAPSSGAAYVFVRNGTNWTQEAYLKASNAQASDLFGFAVSVYDDTVLVTARNEASDADGVNGDQTDNSVPNSGAAYIFVRNGTSWAQEAYLKASNSDGSDYFGWSASLSSDYAVIGAPFELGGDSGVNGDQGNHSVGGGAAYLFVRNGANWTQQAYLKPSNPFYSAGFGESVATSAAHVVLGADAESSNGIGVNGNQFNFNRFRSGAAYLLDRDVGLSTISDLCFGDGGDQLGCTNCPCSNNAPIGSRGGCLNSASTSTRLYGTGSTSVSSPPFSIEDLRFTLSAAPPFAFSILSSADSVAPANQANPCFGLASGVQSASFDGLRCAVQNIRRHGGMQTDEFGDLGITNNSWGGRGEPPAGIAQSGSGFVTGQTRYFQAIHRDDPLAGCMRGLNSSQAVEVTFTP